MNSFRSISVTLLIISLITFGCVSTACGNNVPSITIEQGDEVDIYSAVIRQIHTNTTFNGTYQPPTLYIIRYKDDRAGDPTIKSSEPILISENVQSEIIIALQDLPTDIIWVNNFSEVEKDSYGTVLDGGAIVTLGNIHPQTDDSVQVPGSHYMAGDGGRWETYVLELIEGEWELTGTTGKISIS
ncbi:MAG: hypothetical protein WC562_05215 [Dehalococcoidia bacterium]